MAEQPDPHTVTAVLEEHLPLLALLPRVLRKYLTPAALVSALVSVAGASVYAVSARHDVSDAQRDIHQLRDTVSELQKQRDVLHDIQMQLGKMGVEVDTIADEVDRQRAWREHIEGIAESPPHAARKRR